VSALDATVPAPRERERALALGNGGTAAMLVNLGPKIAVLAGIVLREGFPRRLIAGCAVAFAGTVVIGTATSKRGFAPSWSALLCVAAALFYAVSVIVQKPLLTRVSPLTITWLAACVGALVCVPWAGTLAHQLPRAQASAIGGWSTSRSCR
jgi:drug/metabolite transporter (DMT)-like permease